MEDQFYYNTYFDIFKKINTEDKPSDVKISTITITCKINCKFEVANITEKIELAKGNIETIKYADKKYRSYNNEPPKKIKKCKKFFYNQITLQVYSHIDEKLINVKMFSNGSIQMSGCKTIPGIISVLNKMFNTLRKIQSIENFNYYTDVPSILSIKNITDFEIELINCDFNIGFRINREKLYEIMLTNNIKCRYTPELGSALITSYKHPKKEITIIIYASGAIVITGAKDCEQINATYKHINILLLNSYHEITDIDNHEIIMQYIDEIE